MSKSDEDFFLELNRASAEVLKTIIYLNPWILNGTDIESVSMHDKELLCKRLKLELNSFSEIKAANRKYEWGK
jgi:hypothetical protein